MIVAPTIVGATIIYSCVPPLRRCRSRVLCRSRPATHAHRRRLLHATIFPLARRLAEEGPKAELRGAIASLMGGGGLPSAPSLSLQPPETLGKPSLPAVAPPPSMTVTTTTMSAPAGGSPRAASE